MIYSARDIAGAVFLLVALAMTMVFTLELVNFLGYSRCMTQPIVDISAQLNDINDNPYDGCHFWIYFAFFSTLIPTILHAAIWSSAPTQKFD